MNIHIVDDEELALDYLENLLTKTGIPINIYRFSDPDEAIRAAKKTSVDAVLLDIEFPGRNGFEIAEQYFENNKGTDVAFVTAHKEYALQAFDIEATDYLVKPINYERLYQTVKRFSRRKLLAKEIEESNRIYLSTKSVITIRLFGESAVELKWRTMKAREVFLYLLHYQNKLISKYELIETIWNQQEIEKALQQLYTTIYHIRKELKPYSGFISINRKEEGYILELKNVEVDVFNWKNRLEMLDDINCEHNKFILEKLLTDYDGNYFPQSLYVWPEKERANQRLLWVEKAKDLAFCYKKERNFVKALEWYRAILNKEKSDENIHFEIMKIYASQNKLGLLKKQYESLCEILNDDLGVLPRKDIQLWYKKQVN